MSCDCSHHPGVYRALVTYSNEDTGEIRVKVPSVFGVSQDVAISYIGRSSSNGFWTVPEVGEQIVVTTDDKNFSNIFWMQTDQIAQPTTSTTFEYKVGDTGPGGGTIFFVDRYNEYADFTYLEVGPTGTEALRTWAPSSPVNYQSAVVSGADSKALGAGYQNTIDIVAQGHITTSAAYYCDQLTHGDKSDWYLPSLAELSLVYRVVAFQLNMPGFINFQNYWSSSEFSATQAWAIQMTNDTNLTSSKSNPAWVRPVRRF
jgi:hypothetical protein